MSAAPLPSRDLSQVPAERLVELLRDRVHTSGIRLVELLGRDGPPGTDLDPALLSEDAVRTLAQLMEHRVGFLLTVRFPAVVDLAAGQLHVGGRSARLRWRRTFEQVCRRYLGLVNEARGLDRAERFPLRADDLEAITLATGVSLDSVRSQMWREMGALAAAGASTPGRRLLLPVAGVVVSAGAIGGLELARRSGGQGNLLGPASTVASGGADSAVPADQVAAPDPASGSQRVRAEDVFADGRLVVPTLPPRTEETARLDAGEQGEAVEGLGGPPSGTPAALFAAAPDSTENPETLGAAALELIGYDWREQLPGWSIEFLEERPGRLGYAFFTEQRIEVYVRLDQTPEEVAEVIAHELGHAVDVSLFDNEDRATWLAVRDLDGEPWWPEPGARSDFASGAGDFAESFAHWLLGDETRSELAGTPTTGQLAVLESLVEG